MTKKRTSSEKGNMIEKKKCFYIVPPRNYFMVTLPITPPPLPSTLPPFSNSIHGVPRKAKKLKNRDLFKSMCLTSGVITLFLFSLWFLKKG